MIGLFMRMIILAFGTIALVPKFDLAYDVVEFAVPPASSEVIVVVAEVVLVAELGVELLIEVVRGSCGVVGGCGGCGCGGRRRGGQFLIKVVDLVDKFKIIVASIKTSHGVV